MEAKEKRAFPGLLESTMSVSDAVVLRAESMSSTERHDLIRSLRSVDAKLAKRIRQQVRPRFAAWLKKARYAADLTQAEVAQHIGLTRVAFTNYEAGKQGCSIEMFLALCNCLSAEPVVALQEILSKEGGGDE